MADDLYEHHCLLNQKRVFRCQRVANYRQEQQGDTYDYSNSDLHNVINIGRDARNVIISRKKESEEMEAYSPSSNYRIIAHAFASFKKRKPSSTLPQGKPRTQHFGETPLGGDRIKKRSYASASCTQIAPTRSSSATHSVKLLELLW